MNKEEERICPNEMDEGRWKCRRPLKEAKWVKYRSGHFKKCPCGWTYKFKENPIDKEIQETING